MSRSRDGEPTFTETARRAQIVQAAITTVNEVGYPRASLAAIASRAGVAKSGIMYYFATKDALLLHVVEQVFTALDDLLAEGVALHPDPESQLRAYVDTYLAYVGAHRSEVAAGVEIVVSHRGTDGTPLYLTATDEDSALLRGILRDGMEAGVFRRMSLRLAVGLVEALLEVPTTELQRDLNADLTDALREVGPAILRSLATGPD